MVKSKPLSHRERREATLLLQVVFAHMAFSSAKNNEDRERAHGHFEQAVRMLYSFLNNEE
jgi:streptomycin 6-kinase